MNKSLKKINNKKAKKKYQTVFEPKKNDETFCYKCATNQTPNRNREKKINNEWFKISMDTFILIEIKIFSFVYHLLTWKQSDMRTKKQASKKKILKTTTIKLKKQNWQIGIQNASQTLDYCKCEWKWIFFFGLSVGVLFTIFSVQFRIYLYNILRV